MIMNSTNDNLPMNRHSIKADVMGVRWLRAVASFILLKTKKGRAFSYITFCHFNKPKTIPIAKTPIIMFFGVKKPCGVSDEPLLVCFLLSILGLVAVSVYGATTEPPLPPYPMLILPCGVFASIKLGGSLCLLFLTIVPSIISPFLKFIPKCEEPAGRKFASCVKIYFAIMNFFSKCWHKYTHNFGHTTTFYGFAEVRGLFVFNKIKFPITRRLPQYR